MMAINQRKINKLLLVFTLLIGSSCSKIKISTPSSRFISPEAQGKLFSGSARLEQQSGTEGTLNFAGNSTENPLELRNNVTSAGLSLDFGLLEKLDFIIKGHSDAPSVYTLKYQLLGESRKNAAKENKSLAFTLGYGYELQNQSESDKSILSNTNDDLSAEVEQSLLEFSLIYGYRPEADTLVYASIQTSKQDINFSLESTDNATLNDQTFSLNTWAYGASVGGVRYFEKYYLNLEMSAQKTQWTHNDSITYAFINMALGYRWD